MSGSLLISAWASGRAANTVELSPELSRPATKLDICRSARIFLRHNKIATFRALSRSASDHTLLRAHALKKGRHIKCLTLPAEGLT